MAGGCFAAARTMIFTPTARGPNRSPGTLRSKSSLRVPSSGGRAWNRALRPAVRRHLHMKQIYPIILTPEKEGGYSVLVPDLQIGTQGESVAECIDMARDAIGLWGICEQDAG